ncbi:hypothetical protein H7097_01070 [Aeromicrobium sp.]|nr:hypothetical protein [Candidatus Saccharibacteria bacterium]
MKFSLNIDSSYSTRDQRVDFTDPQSVKKVIGRDLLFSAGLRGAAMSMVLIGGLHAAKDAEHGIESDAIPGGLAIAGSALRIASGLERRKTRRNVGRTLMWFSAYKTWPEDGSIDSASAQAADIVYDVQRINQRDQLNALVTYVIVSKAVDQLQELAGNQVLSFEQAQQARRRTEQD